MISFLKVFATKLDFVYKTVPLGKELAREVDDSFQS
jgi:hypothetical protein